MNRATRIHEPSQPPERARIRLATALLVVLALLNAAVTYGEDVNSTADDGAAGTLRVAIDAANASAGSSTIRILVGNDQTITLAADPVAEPPRPLPIGITQPLTIDANSSLGLTLTRIASSGDSFNLTADTTFVDVAQFTNGGISVGSGVDLTLNQSSQAGEISSVLSGSGALTKDGTNTLTLSGKNSWAGGTTITGGELVITTGDSLPKSSAAGIADVTVEKNGTLNFTNTSAASYTYTGSIDGKGGVLKSGTGTVELSGPTAGIQNDWQGGTEILEGTLKVTRLSSLPQTGTTDVNISGSSGILELHMKTNGTYNGVVSGRGQLKKSGTAQLTLGSINTYTGGTSITEGILTGKWSNGTSTLGTGGVEISSTGTLNLDTAAGPHEIFDRRIEGAGKVTKSGAGELTLSAGSNTFSGGITLDQGTLVGTTSSIPGAIHFNGGTTVTFDQGFDGTHGGVIDGAGEVRIDGKGATVTLTGDNTYTAGTFVDAGGLVVTTNSLPVAVPRLGIGSCMGGQPNPDACLATGTNLTFSETTGATWLGLIDGPGSVSKRGSGALTLTKAQLYTGNTTVSEGTLFFNTTLETTRVDVAHGATLGGLGTLSTAAPTHVAGTIAPGDVSTLGTLTLNGPVTFDKTSSLRVRVDPNHNHDSLKVATPQLVTITSGAKLIVDVLPGDYPVAAFAFPALQATNRPHKFHFTDDYAFLKVHVTQTPNHPIWVHVGLDPAANVASFARTRNERAVGNALVNVFATPNPVGDALQSMETTQVPSALDQLSGVPLTSSFTTRVAESQRFSRSVARRVRVFANRESPRRQFQEAPTPNPGAVPRWRRDASFFRSPTNPSPLGQLYWDGSGGDGPGGEANSGWGGWLDGYGVFGELDSSINASGYDYKIYGGTGAIDYAFEDALLLGASVGYARTDIDAYAAYRAESTGDTARAALYAAYANPAIGAYGTVMVSYAWSQFEDHRQVHFIPAPNTAKGRFKGNEFSAYGELGTRAFEFEELSLHPFLGLGYGYFDRGSFTESGADPSVTLSVFEQVYQSLNLSAGTTLDQVFELGPELKLRAEIRARYEYEFLDTNPRMQAIFLTSRQGFTVEGASTGRNVALVGASIEFIDAGGLSTFLNYDARVNGEFLENTVSLGILVEF